VSAAGNTSSGDRLDALLDAAVDAMVLIDTKGRITRFNRSAERVFGYRAEDVAGQNVRMLMPEPFRSEHDGYLARYHATGERRIIGLGRSVTACRRDGSTFPIDLSVGEFVADGERGYVGILRDISERQMQESRFRHKAEQLRLLLEHAPTPVIVTDPSGRIQNVNVACLNLLGYERQELETMRLSDLIETEDRADVLADFHHVRQESDTRQREVRVRHRGGEPVPVLLYVGCGRDNEGRPMLFIAELIDRSALQQATYEADRLRDRLAHASRLGMLGEMVSGIAHEVNQPLAAITNYASACRRMLSSGQTTPGELLEVLGKISRQAERAGQVIRGLRSLVRDRDVERPVPLELNPVVEEVAALAEIDLRGTPLRLELDLSEGLPRVLGNGVQIQQVVINLIRNGAEAMREAQREGRVLVTTALTGDRTIEIRVRDQGPGVDPTIEPRLFDPFLTTKPQGMGLGLSICKSIAQAHGGELTYRRSPEGGAEFTLRLPVMVEEEAE
jgi:two-component system, LuxR family, sensor kinase FixL